MTVPVTQAVDAFCSCSCNGAPWHTMVYPGIPWYSMVYHGIPWFTMVCNGNPWYTMVYHGMTWYTNGMQWQTVVYHGIPWYTMAWYIMVYHGQLVIQQVRRLSSIGGSTYEAIGSEGAEAQLATYRPSIGTDPFSATRRYWRRTCSHMTRNTSVGSAELWHI